MANYNTIKQGIKNVIKQNGTRAITGNVLQNVLVNMVDSLGKYGKFAGVATPQTAPAATDENVFYVASETGSYTKFGSITVYSGELAFITNMNGLWEKFSVSVGASTQSDFHKITVSGELLNVQNHDTGITASSWGSVLKFKMVQILGEVGPSKLDMAYVVGWQQLENKDILLALVGMSYKYPTRLVPMLGQIKNTAGNGRLYISEASMGEGIPDAPSDGQTYGRNNNNWVKIPDSTGGGIPDAPSDGQTYGRNNNNWVKIPDSTGGGIPDAPSDGKTYGRKNGEWNSIDVVPLIITTTDSLVQKEKQKTVSFTGATRSQLKDAITNNRPIILKGTSKDGYAETAIITSVLNKQVSLYWLTARVVYPSVAQNNTTGIALQVNLISDGAISGVLWVDYHDSKLGDKDDTSDKDGSAFAQINWLKSNIGGASSRIFDGNKVDDIVQMGGFSDVFVIDNKQVNPQAGDLLYAEEGIYGKWGVITDVHLEGRQLYVTYVWEGCVNTIMIDENGDAARYVNRYKTPKVYDAQSVLSASSAGNMQDYFLIKDPDNPTQSFFEFWQVGDLIGSPKGGIIVSDILNPGGLDNTMVYVYGGEIVTIVYAAQSPSKIKSIKKTKIGDYIAMALESVSGSTVTKQLSPNIFYEFGTVTNLTITFQSGQLGHINEYMFQFTSGSTPTTLSLPQSVKWLNGQPLQVQANKTYQVSIVNNLAVGGEF